MIEGLTKPRERAFRVLVAEQAAGRCARESNVTDERAGYIYWQSARWLVESGLAYFPTGSTTLALTPNGREEAQSL